MGPVFVWMDGGTESLRVAELVECQGIDFVPTTEFLDSPETLPAKKQLMDDLKQARVVLSTGDVAKKQAACAALLACEQDNASGEYAEGDRECTKAEPVEISTASFALGALAPHCQNWSEAVRLFEVAVRASPVTPDNHNQLGVAF